MHIYRSGISCVFHHLGYLLVFKRTYDWDYLSYRHSKYSINSIPWIFICHEPKSLAASNLLTSLSSKQHPRLNISFTCAPFFS